MHPSELPQFNFLLGDIVYSFGESQYYFDQFYEPYRDYQAPILAVAGNHDGMVSPLGHEKSLQSFVRNFCSDCFQITPDAGHLSRTAQIQPGVFFTFEAPFVRIIALYSNTLEDPGVIADDLIGDSQLTFLRAALERVKQEGFAGALLFAGKLFDAFIAPLVGNASDRAVTRFGRRRPFLLAGAVLCPAGLLLVFHPPVVSLPMLFAALVVISLGYSCFNIPYLAMTAEMTHSPTERTSLMSWRIAFVGEASIWFVPIHAAGSRRRLASSRSDDEGDALRASCG